MTRAQKTVEEMLAEVAEKKRKLLGRQKELEDRRKASDTRKRLKGEKALLRALFAQAPSKPNLQDELARIVETAALNAGEREAALWVLAVHKTASSPDA